MEKNAHITAIFNEFQQYLNEDQDKKEEIRLVVRDLEQRAREILALLQTVHQPGGLDNIPQLCSKSREMLGEIKAKFAELASKIAKDQYYRYHDHWRFIIQRLSFLCAFIVYLESEKIVGRDECATMLAIKCLREEGFHMDLDDYLMGLLQLASELSRLSVNAVTAGDYDRPKRIAQFVNELNSGFRLLNLKNDSLRKRYDGLKYDLKKVEEVVYDVTIRGLCPATEPSESMEKK